MKDVYTLCNIVHFIRYRPIKNSLKPSSCGTREPQNYAINTMAPSLLTISTELQLEIISHLGFPEIGLLRLTCRRFHTMIKPFAMPDLVRYETSPYCMPRDLYACKAQGPTSNESSEREAVRRYYQRMRPRRAAPTNEQTSVRSIAIE